MERKEGPSIPIPQIPESDLDAIKCVTLSDTLAENHLDFLAKLHDLNINPIFVVEPVNIHTIKEIGFEPKTLIYNAGHETDLSIISELTSLDNLVITAFDDYPKIEIPEFPGLTKLLVNLEDTDYLGSFSKMDHLRELKINNYDPSMIEELAQLRHLKSLWLGTQDSIINLINIDTLSQLKRLTIKTDPNVSMKNFMDLGKLESLKWLGVPVSTEQEEFDEVISSLQKLECLELYPYVDDLSIEVLTALPNLKYLKLADTTISDRKTLPLLTSLELLSIPDGTYKDSLYLAELQAALPNTTIVPNAGLCMGSGWMLLIIPSLLVLLIIKLEWNTIKTKRDKNA